MIKTQNKYSKEQFIEAYSLYKKNTAIKDIAEKTGIPNTSLYMLMGNIDNYISGKKAITEKTSSLYKEVVAYFTNNNSIQSPKVTTVEVPDVDKLEQAFDNLKDVIVEFIIKAADKRAEAIVKAKEQQLAEQKEKYEQELLRLQAIIASAKDSSITGLLKRKMTDFL